MRGERFRTALIVVGAAAPRELRRPRGRRRRNIPRLGLTTAATVTVLAHRHRRQRLRATPATPGATPPGGTGRVGEAFPASAWLAVAAAAAVPLLVAVVVVGAQRRAHGDLTLQSDTSALQS